MKKVIYVLFAVLAVACTQKPQTEQPAQTPLVLTDQVQLLKPPTVGGVTINEALYNRVSTRAFSEEKLTLEEVSGVLWAAAGVNRENGKLTSPSALGLYPTVLYVFFEEGVYQYHSDTHSLTKVLDGDQRTLSATQAYAYTAPLNIVCVANKAVYADKPIPAEHVQFLCGQDAAGYLQNVSIYAAGHGLKSVTRGSAHESLLSTLQLDPTQYSFTLAITVGK